jgi:hypothetical protein
MLTSTVAARRHPAIVAALLTIAVIALITAFSWGSTAQATGATSPAYPPQSPPPTTSCVVTVLSAGGQPQTSLSAGETVTVAGTGFTPDAVGQIVLHSNDINLGTARADANGALSQSVTIPASLASGTHTLTVVMPNMTCQLGFDPASSGIDAASAVKSAASTTGSSTSSGLASTGFAAVTASIIAVVLIGGGAMFVLIGRRRRV